MDDSSDLGAGPTKPSPFEILRDVVEWDGEQEERVLEVALSSIGRVLVECRNPEFVHSLTPWIRKEYTGLSLVVMDPYEVYFVVSARTRQGRFACELDMRVPTRICREFQSIRELIVELCRHIYLAETGTQLAEHWAAEAPGQCRVRTTWGEVAPVTPAAAGGRSLW